MARTIALFAIAASVLLSGCIGVGSAARARTLDPGDWELSGAVGLTGIDTPGPSREPGYRHEGPSPEGPLLEAGIAVGVAPRLEVGARAYFFGAQASATAQLVRSRWIDLAVAPGVSFDLVGRPYGGSSPARAWLPALVGVNLSDRVQVVAAPHVAFALDAPLAVGPEIVGASLGVHWAPRTPGKLRRLAVAITWAHYACALPVEQIDAPRSGQFFDARLVLFVGPARNGVVER